MQAGRLDQPVNLLRRDIATAPSGVELETFVFERPEWARVTAPPARGDTGEDFDGAQRSATALYNLRIRFDDELDETWRLVWRGDEYEIHEVKPGGQRLSEFLDLTASASPAENPSG